jgi:hypothetical protein
MGLWSAVALQPGRLPPATVPPKIRLRGCSKTVLEHLDPEGQNTHWYQYLEQLNDKQRDGIADFLFAIILRRKIRRREFDAAYGLLKMAGDLGVANTPMSSQAVEMLERLSIFADARVLGRK